MLSRMKFHMTDGNTLMTDSSFESAEKCMDFIGKWYKNPFKKTLLFSGKNGVSQSGLCVTKSALVGVTVIEVR